MIGSKKFVGWAFFELRWKIFGGWKINLERFALSFWQYDIAVSPLNNGEH